MRAIHLIVGYAIVAAFAVLFLWGLGARALRREPGRAFWVVLAFAQVTLIVQLIAGIVLLLLGGRPPWLHFIYGIVGPAIVLGVAHWLGREAWKDRPWVVFAWAAFFCFGLTLRAVTTGLFGH